MKIGIAKIGKEMGRPLTAYPHTFQNYDGARLVVQGANEDVYGVVVSFWITNDDIKEMYENMIIFGKKEKE